MQTIAHLQSKPAQKFSHGQALAPGALQGGEHQNAVTGLHLHAVFVHRQDLTHSARATRLGVSGPDLEAVVAARGLGARKRIEGAHAALDLVITDEVMPRMSGSQMAAEILGSRPDLPIGVVTCLTGGVFFIWMMARRR